jgi:glycosyltransferase involved in cell wall biosynthesis
MRLLALTFGDANQASSKYRVYQYIEPARALNINIEPRLATGFADWSALAQYEAVLVQKKLFSVGLVKRLRKLTKRLIYDVDDAIWHPHGKPHSFLTNLRTRMRLKAIISAADVILAANEVIAEYLRQWSKKVHVLPMALDEHVWLPRGLRQSTQMPCIGWAGHPVNLPYLEAIEPALVRVQNKFPDATFRILCGQAPNFRQLRYEHVPFKPDTESEIIRSFDVGLLPLPGGAFAEAKSPIKALQYMASSVATILTPAGATRTMFHDRKTGLFATDIQQWKSALTQLLGDPRLLQEIGLNARRAFEQQYALSRTAPAFATLLRGAECG